MPSWGRLFVVLVLLSLVGLAKAGGHLSDNALINQARELIEKGRNHAALEALREARRLQRRGLMRVLPAHRHDVWFLTGLASARAARQTAEAAKREALLRGAVVAFNRILLDRPNALRVRLELAHAYFLLGEDAQASEHFLRVLASRAPRAPPAMAANIERFLAIMRERNDPWSGYFSVAAAPSSNINSGTANRVIYIFGLPYEIREESRRESGTGLLLSGGGQYEARMGDWADKWRWRFGADAARADYRGGDHDTLQVSFRTGPRVLLSDTADAGAQALAGQAWRAGAREHDFWGLSVAGSKRLGARLRLSGDASWRYLTYRELSYLDGWRAAYQARAGWRGASWWRLDGLLGFSESRAQRENQRNAAWRASADATFFLPWGWQLGAGAEWGRTRYEGVTASVPGVGAQRDSRRVWRASVLNTRFVVAGFAPRLTLAREAQRSNSVFNDYDRNSAQLSVVRRF